MAKDKVRALGRGGGDGWCGKPHQMESERIHSKDLEFYSTMRSHERILSKSDRRPGRRPLQQSR